MDKNEYNFYEDYYHAQGLKPYHDMPYLDGLKSLSEIAEPLVLRLMLTEKYENAVEDLGISCNNNFADFLYKSLNGDEGYVVVEELDSVMVRDTKILAMSIRFPYFERVEKYFKSIGRRVRVQSEYVVYDIQVQGKSLIEESLRGKKIGISHTHGSYGQDTPWVMNSIQYALTSSGGFYLPYNGIGSLQVISITRDFIKDSSRGYRSDPLSKQIDYVNRVLVDSCYDYDGKDFFKILTDVQIKELNKKVSEVFNSIL